MLNKADVALNLVTIEASQLIRFLDQELISI